MKTIKRSLMVVLVLMLALAGCAAPPAQSIQIVQEKERSILVDGTGEVTVAPDQAIFVVGIRTQDKNQDEAKKANDEISRKVLAVLDQHAIDPADIKTDYLDIRYEETDYSSAVFVYKVSKSFMVTVRNLDDLEAVISDLLDAGVTQISGLYFKVSDVEKYEQEARSKAIQAARKKAKAMAGELGQDIGEPISMQDSTRVSYLSELYGIESSTKYFASFSSTESSSGTLCFGEISVIATVTIEFSLR